MPKQKQMLELGAMSPKIADQLAGLGIPAKQLRILDGHATAINRLHLHGLITQAERRCADRRLIAKINAVVRKQEERLDRERNRLNAPNAAWRSLQTGLPESPIG